MKSPTSGEAAEIPGCNLRSHKPTNGSPVPASSPDGGSHPGLKRAKSTIGARVEAMHMNEDFENRTSTVFSIRIGVWVLAYVVCS